VRIFFGQNIKSFFEAILRTGLREFLGLKCDKIFRTFYRGEKSFGSENFRKKLTKNLFLL
jgi:hypothetical protein